LFYNDKFGEIMRPSSHYAVQGHQFWYKNQLPISD